jgi:hypothetical protein
MKFRPINLDRGRNRARGRGETKKSRAEDGGYLYGARERGSTGWLRELTNKEVIGSSASSEASTDAEYVPERIGRKAHVRERAGVANGVRGPGQVWKVGQSALEGGRRVGAETAFAGGLEHSCYHTRSSTEHGEMVSGHSETATQVAPSELTIPTGKRRGGEAEGCTGPSGRNLPRQARVGFSGWQRDGQS